jgi:hypothetical protein
LKPHVAGHTPPRWTPRHRRAQAGAGLRRTERSRPIREHGARVRLAYGHLTALLVDHPAVGSELRQRPYMPNSRPKTMRRGALRPPLAMNGAVLKLAALGSDATLGSDAWARRAGSLPVLWWIARGERLTTPVVNYVTLLSGSRRGDERMRIIRRRLRRWVLVASRRRRGWICHRFSILRLVQSCGCCEHVLVPEHSSVPERRARGGPLGRSYGCQGGETRG